MQIPLYKKILSYILPIKLKDWKSEEHEQLSLYLNRNKLQLTTPIATYSDGIAYKPLDFAFKKIRNHIHSEQKFLFLGAGLGSGLHILNALKLYPKSTIVDIDSTILSVLDSFLPKKFNNKVRLICKDAQQFMQTLDKQYDCIVVDIFKDITVPAFATTNLFFQQSAKATLPQGYFIMNYIPINDLEITDIREKLTRVFSKVHHYHLRQNVVFIAKK